MSTEKWIEVISEDLRETKRLANAAEKTADAAMKRADAAWASVDQLKELVIMTRNQYQEEMAYLRRPFWKRWFGMS